MKVTKDIKKAKRLIGIKSLKRNKILNHRKNRRVANHLLKQGIEPIPSFVLTAWDIS